MRAVRARVRLVLTGTPIQNQLQELWSLFDFACKGRLLGDHREFRVRCEPLVRRVSLALLTRALSGALRAEH